MKLPVWSTCQTCYRHLWAERAAAARLAGLPMLIYFAIIALARYLHAHGAIGEALTTLVWIGASLLVVPFAIACHRAVLVGPAELERSTGIELGRREVRFALTTVALTLGFWVLAFVLAMLGGTFFGLIGGLMGAGVGSAVEVGAVFSGIGALAAIWLLGAPLARLFLLLPHVALDHPAEPAVAMRLGAGNSYRFALILLLVNVPLQLLLGIAALLVGGVWLQGPVTAHPLGPIAVEAGIEATLLFGTSMISATALSICYRFLTRPPDEPAAATA
jgi:hypothetical protein